MSSVGGTGGGKDVSVAKGTGPEERAMIVVDVRFAKKLGNDDSRSRGVAGRGL